MPTFGGLYGVSIGQTFLRNLAAVSVLDDTNANSPFESNKDTITVQSNTLYGFEALVLNSGMGATSRATSFSIAGTAVISEIAYQSMHVGVSSASSSQAAQTTKITVSAASTQLASASTLAAENIKLSGIIEVAAGGTLIPKITHSASSQGNAALFYQCDPNSYFSIWPIMANTAGSVGGVS